MTPTCSIRVVGPIGMSRSGKANTSASAVRLETRILLQEAMRRLPHVAMDWDRPFARFAGIVDGVTEAWFTFDQDEAERLMAGEHQSVSGAVGHRDSHKPIGTSPSGVEAFG